MGSFSINNPHLYSSLEHTTESHSVKGAVLGVLDTGEQSIIPDFKVFGA